tara:strand:- start:278 stop:529 length:252 start_codon:yes stop_codon:yes gene_type:complete
MKLYINYDGRKLYLNKAEETIFAYFATRQKHKLRTQYIPRLSGWRKAYRRLQELLLIEVEKDDHNYDIWSISEFGIQAWDERK